MKRKNIIIGGAAIGGVLLGTGIVLGIKNRRTIPKNAKAVNQFDIKKYLGKWYEIARLDFHWEKNMNNTTAEYLQNDDGSIKVINRGYNFKKREDKISVGKAVFVGDQKTAKLKVKFGGQVYSGYNVIEIDPNYKYALVAGRNLNYLWILSRKRHIPEDIKQKYLQIAQNIGYDTENLIWVQHSE
ncbi:MAG: lipocalin family protein [Bacteroidales bacterium]|jgi:apolipoprotein D and lipocalin family protein|nr:lipocalin family protein [Bacteroidales bacterium]